MELYRQYERKTFNNSQNWLIWKKKEKILEKLKIHQRARLMKRTIRNFSIDLFFLSSYNLLSPTKPILEGKKNDFFSRFKTLQLESNRRMAREPKLEDLA